MLPGIETLACNGLAVPQEVMHHVVRVESSFNPYAIGVVGGRLVRQPKTLAEALSTVRMLEQKGYNFSIGLAQVNRYNLEKYGLQSYEKAFEPCANLMAGSRILAECYGRSGGDWGKSFSCYYSGNFSTGFRHGYVQKIYASIRQGRDIDEDASDAHAIDVVGRESRKVMPVTRHPIYASYASGQTEPQAQMPSRVESVASRRIPVTPQAPSTDPAYVASQSAAESPVSNQATAAQAAAQSQRATDPVAAARPGLAQAMPSESDARPVARAERRTPVVLQPYSASAAPAEEAPASTRAPRVSVPPVDRAQQRADEAFVF